MSDRMVFVCCPVRATETRSIERHLADAAGYCVNVAMQGDIPICPHLWLCGPLDDRDYRQREIGMAMGREALLRCDEVRVFGDRISRGMAAEIALAKDKCIPVVFDSPALAGAAPTVSPAAVSPQPFCSGAGLLRLRPRQQWRQAVPGVQGVADVRPPTNRLTLDTLPMVTNDLTRLHHYQRAERKRESLETFTIAALEQGPLLPIVGPAAVSIIVADSRADVDARIKCILDGLENIGVFENDKQVNELTVLRAPSDAMGPAVLIQWWPSGRVDHAEIQRAWGQPVAPHAPKPRKAKGRAKA